MSAPASLGEISRCRVVGSNGFSETVEDRYLVPMHDPKKIVTAGAAPSTAQGALILIHGRGATAESIIPLAHAVVDDELRERLAVVAPQADGNTWYPFSFLAPIEDNEPYLTDALDVITKTVEKLRSTGIDNSRIVLGGFSQGACLASEWVARNPNQVSGLLALSGGLIGPPGTPRDYPGSLEGTRGFVGCSDADFHIPKERVEETAMVLSRMGAEITMDLYPGMGHTVNEDEVEKARTLIQALMS